MSNNLLPDFPPPPWRLRGEGLIMLAFPEVERTQSFLPAPLTIQSIFPGRTIGGYYIARYTNEPGSEEHSVWHEWGNVLCAARSGSTRALFINAMVVDSESSLAGGRREWGLNKDLAEYLFEKTNSGGRVAFQNRKGRVAVQWKRYGVSIPLRGTMRFLSIREQSPHRFSSSLKAKFQLCRITIETMQHPEFSFHSRRRYWGVYFHAGEIEVEEPEGIEGISV
jgi:hypothetical protein